MRWIKYLALTLSAAAIQSCTENDASNRASSISRDGIIASYKQSLGPVVLLQKVYFGGATGETLYKVWSCRQQFVDCRLQAVIDTNDATPPILQGRQSTVRIIVNDSDVVWSFSNISIDFQNIDLRLKLVSR